MSREGKQSRIVLNKPELRVETEEELPVLEGYAALFDVRTDLGYFTESIAQGAFRDSINRKDDVRALIDHDSSRIIARSPKTLSLKEDERGLFVRIWPSNTQSGRDIVESIRRGDVNQMSFGFFIEEEEANFESDVPHFTIKKVRLFDVSVVTFPAYKETSIEIQRHLTPDEDLKARIETARARHELPKAELEKRRRDLSLLEL